MAEAVFQHMVDEAGLSDRIEVDSAGTSGINEGSPAHRGTRSVLRHQGIDYEGCSRQVTLADLDEADYVVAMDYENVYDLHHIDPEHILDGKLHLLLDFAAAELPPEVPDPIYDGRFDYVYELVEDGCRGLLEHIRAKHRL
jgi:protein-tyrosine phosphatase